MERDFTRDYMREENRKVGNVWLLRTAYRFARIRLGLQTKKTVLDEYLAMNYAAQTVLAELLSQKGFKEGLNNLILPLVYMTISHLKTRDPGHPYGDFLYKYPSTLTPEEKALYNSHNRLKENHEGAKYFVERRASTSKALDRVISDYRAVEKYAFGSQLWLCTTTEDDLTGVSRSSVFRPDPAPNATPQGAKRARSTPPSQGVTPFLFD